MKKFQISCICDNREQYLGEASHNDISDDFIGDYVEAENAENAIIDGMDYLLEQLNSNSEVDAEYECDKYDKPIAILVKSSEDNSIIECYYNFTAKEKDGE